MRVLVLGGTRFIGRGIVEELVAAQHTVTVVHRGDTEPADLPAVTHIHQARDRWDAAPDELRATRPDAVIDCLAMSRADAEAAISAIGETPRLVVLSSQDIYRAFESLNDGRRTDAVPLDEDSPLSGNRYTHRERDERLRDYSKQDVEDVYLAHGAVVLRLPAVYGEHDPQRREDFILRRLRAGRARIPVGPAGFLWTRGYVRDIARGVRRAAEVPAVDGRVYNLGEARSWTIGMWAERIIEAAGVEAELVQVADASLPEDMAMTAAALTQHVLVSSARARLDLGYVDSDPMDALRASVRWHLDHRPSDDDGDFAADDAALAQSRPPAATD